MLDRYVASYVWQLRKETTKVFIFFPSLSLLAVLVELACWLLLLLTHFHPFLLATFELRDSTGRPLQHACYILLLLLLLEQRLFRLSECLSVYVSTASKTAWANAMIVST